MKRVFVDANIVIDLLCKMCTPTAVDASVVKNALASGFTDFEDALQR